MFGPVLDPDARRLARARRGDRVALRALCEGLYPWIEGYVARRVDTSADRDDVVAACFERLLGNLDRIDPAKGSVRGYALAIARNLIVDHHRARRRTAHVAPETFDARADDGRGPEDLLLARSADRALAEAVSHLSATDREVLALTYGEGLSAPEVAQVLDLDPAAVRKRLSRARKRLRTKLAAEKGALSHVDPTP